MTGKTDPAAESLRSAARELVDIATTIHDAAAHATAALTDGALLRALPHAPSSAGPAYGALLRATTSGAGLGYALTGGPAATLAAKAGAVLGAESLAVRVLATSLRLRISAVVNGHPELAGDPMITRLVDAAAADRDLEALRALRALVKDRGAVRALSRLAPVLGEVLALRALLDENPLNDTTAWLIATGKGYASADPIIGVSNKIIAVLDVGEGAARPVELSAAEQERLCTRGSLLGFLGNISALGTGGRVLIQSVEGPDGVIRHVLQAPGMRTGHPDSDSPQDLLGAFSSAVLNSSPYSRALAKAVADYGVPQGAELALVGHSAGGAAIMNLAQDAEFCARHTVTHVVAVGSPVDFKQPADPRTWVASVTNQHDIVPTLDGQGAGNCFDLHPDWYIVDYADATHLFPICHSIDRYVANLADDLPEDRAHIDSALTPYRGVVVRSQAYRLFDRPPVRPDFPFLTVPTHATSGPDGPIDLPIRTRDGTALTSYFAVPADAARDVLDVTGPAVLVGGHVLIAVHATRNHDTSTTDHHELHVGIVVPGPPRPGDPPGAAGAGRGDVAGVVAFPSRPRPSWLGGLPGVVDLVRGTDLMGVVDLVRRVEVRSSGSLLVGSAVDDPVVQGLAPTLWGGETYLTKLELRVRPRAVRLAGDRVFTLRGRLGPAVPVSDPGFVGYAREGDVTLRSSVRARGRARLHPAPVLRLDVEPSSSHPLAEVLRALGLDGARPLLCLSSTGRQSLRDTAVPVPPT